MSDRLSQPLSAVSGPKLGKGDDAESAVSESGGKAAALDAEFCEALQVIETPGYLKSYFTLPKLARSGLSVYHVGNIVLPLGEIQARQIKGQAKPDGVATSTWRLDPRHFKLDYSVWEGRLKALYRNIAPGLGCGQDWIDSVRAKPSALLLMEKGATLEYSFNYSSDGAGHILVYLPSADLQGGEIVSRVGGQEKTVFDPSKTEAHFGCWLPNSKPQPVKSGYALVIMFSFFPIKGNISGSALFWRNETRAIRHTLKQWLTKDAKSRERSALYQPIERDYLQTTLRLKELLMEDSGRLQVLQRISDNFGFRLFLGYIERDQKKLENNDDYEDVEGGLRITKLRNLEGHLVTEHLPLGNAHVSEGFFKYINWTYQKHNPSSFTRKGRMTFFVVVPLDSIVSFFVQRGSGDNNLSARVHLPRLLGEYARMCVSGQPSKSTLSIFEELCEIVWDYPRNISEEGTQGLFQNQKPEFLKNDLIDVLKATVKLKWYPLFEKIAVAHEGSLSTSFFGWIPETLHKSNVEIGTWFGPLETGLSAAVLSYPRVKQQVRAVETLFPIVMADTGRLVTCPPECLILWARKVLRECVKSCGSKKLDRKDGEALVKLCLYFDDPIAMISQVENRIDPESKPDAFLGFMSGIDNFGRCHYMFREKSDELGRKACRTFITSAAFRQMHGKEKDVSNETNFVSQLGDLVFGKSVPNNTREHNESGSGYGDFMTDVNRDYLDMDVQRAQEDIPDEIDSDMDLDEPGSDPFGYHVHHLNYDDYKAYKAYQEYELNGGKPETKVVENQVQSTTLGSWLDQAFDSSTKDDDIFSLALDKIVEVAPQIPGVDLHTLWLPALRQMAHRVAGRIFERAKDPTMLLWRQNVSALIKAYLNNYVGKWPQRPRLVQEGVECGCADCKGLNIFLADASLKTGRFIASKKRCNHLVKITSRGDVDVYAARKKIKGNSRERKLLVTKSRSKMLTRARKAWRERRDEATKQLGAFEQYQLSTLLGPEWMTIFSMAHLGGPGLSDLDMRKALRLKTERHDIPVVPARIDPSSIAMVFEDFAPMSLDDDLEDDLEVDLGDDLGGGYFMYF